MISIERINLEENDKSNIPVKLDSTDIKFPFRKSDLSNFQSDTSKAEVIVNLSEKFIQNVDFLLTSDKNFQSKSSMENMNV